MSLPETLARCAQHADSRKYLASSLRVQLYPHPTVGAAERTADTPKTTSSVRLNYALSERKRLDCMAASARVRASLRQSTAERNELLALTEEARRLQAARADRARRARLARQRIARCETRCAIVKCSRGPAEGKVRRASTPNDGPPALLEQWTHFYIDQCSCSSLRCS